MKRIFASLAVLVGCAGSAFSQEAAAERMLDPVRQQAVWDAEHVTFQIEQRFGKRFLGLLRSGDRAQISQVFHGEFAGMIVGAKAPLAELEKVGVQQIRREGEPVAASVEETIGALLAPLGEIAEIDRMGLRVLKISDAGGGRWDTKLLLSADGRSAGGGLVAVDSLHQVGFRMADEAELQDAAVISSWTITSERERRAPGALMEEATNASGLTLLPIGDNWKLPPGRPPAQFRFQFAVEDFDRDGFLDIAVASLNGPAALLKSVGGKRFVVANQAFRVKPLSTRQGRALACWIDFDDDGFPDLILGDRVYRNEGGKGFQEITQQSGLVFPQEPMGAVVADYDGDGLSDLYVLYQFSHGAGADPEIVPWVGDDISGAENALWRNLGGGKFEDVTAQSGAGGGVRNSFAATWLYADDDHLPDLYVANDFGRNNLLRNLGNGQFEEIAEAAGVADFATSMGVASGDLDNDGRPEVYVANMYSKMGRRIIGQVSEADYAPGIYDQIKGACAGNRLYRLGGAGESARELSEALGINDVGWAYAPAITDFDNDGLLDLYATTGFLSFDRTKPDG